MKIGIVANLSKSRAVAVVRQIDGLAQAHGVQTFLETEIAGALRRKGFGLAALLRKIDLLIVVGGDGSLLRVVHNVYPRKVPLFGVNLGRLGFLTAVRHDELAAVLPDVFGKRLRTSVRRPLELKIHTRKGKTVIPCALNDVVFNRSSSQMAVLRVKADGLAVNEYVADGLILATATGSTAYAMAAGGPILSPESGGILISPICPHTLSNRAIVLPETCHVRVDVPAEARRIDIQYDGVSAGSLHPGDWAEVRVARAPVVLSFLAYRDFFQILREKLQWRGATTGDGAGTAQDG
jgi:NAD+ kinase